MTTIEFLQRWEPAGPWVLTAISSDVKKTLVTATFGPDDLKELEGWLNEYNGKWNLYFHVNRVLTKLFKKAQRQDIKDVTWLHIDIDPRAGYGIEDEQTRALGLLTHSLPKGLPKPTVIVYSGGGYQGFWKLVEPIKVDGNLGIAEDAKLYNVALEKLFGGDNCHNIDRIMRLPGTMNVPDPKKKKKGRKVVEAKVIEFNDNSYTLDQFPKEHKKDTGQIETQSIPLPENVRRLKDITDLDQWNVPDRVKVIIVQGRNDDPYERQRKIEKGDESRSAWVFDAVCEMCRCSVPDDVIFSVLTDPDFGISESILEAGSNAEKYALRQVARGKEFAEDPVWRHMQEKYFYVNTPKPRVFSEGWSEEAGRYVLDKWSTAEFKDMLQNQEKAVHGEYNKDGTQKTMPLAAWWLKKADRRTYHRIGFVPNKELKGDYNLWKGFGVQPSPNGSCERFLDHLKHILCQGNEEHYEYLINWCAEMIQKPGEIGKTAVVLRGPEGTGKGCFAKNLGVLLGRHYLQITNAKHLVGNFNEHLRNVVLLFADEAFYAADKGHASMLKALITEDTMLFEGKGVDAVVGRNYTHLIMASNEEWVVPAGPTARRFFVLDVGDEQKRNKAYFDPIYAELEAGGYERLLDYLQKKDLTGFDVRNVPQTQALEDQKTRSLNPFHAWWRDKLLSGEIMPKVEFAREEKPKRVVKQKLLDDCLKYMDVNKYSVYDRRECNSMQQFSHSLLKICPKIDTYVRLTLAGKRVWAFGIPDLDTCRGAWEKFFNNGVAQNWPVPNDDEVEEVAEEEIEKEQEPF